MSSFLLINLWEIKTFFIAKDIKYIRYKMGLFVFLQTCLLCVDTTLFHPLSHVLFFVLE